MVEVVENVSVFKVNLNKGAANLGVVLGSACDIVDQHFVGKTEVALQVDGVISAAAFFFD